MPASSTRSTSPGSSRARASGLASTCDQCPSSSHRNPCWWMSHAAENASVPTCCRAACAALRVGVTTTSRRSLGVEYVARGGERRGLAGAGGTFDDEQTSLAGQGGDDLPLGDVEVVGPVDAGGVLDRCHRTRGEAVDQLCLDGEDAVGGEVPDVVGYVGAFAQCSASRRRTGGEVLGELDACGSIGDDPDGRDQLLGFASDVGGVPCGALRSQAREDQLDGDVAFEPADGASGRA